MAHAIDANGKEAAYLGVPWEDAFGYAQAIKVGDAIYVAGQLAHDESYGRNLGDAARQAAR